MATYPVAPWAEPALLTADDLVAISTDGQHFELIEGRLFRMPPTGYDHGMTTTDLASALHAFVTRHGLGHILSGEPGFLISAPGEPDTVLAPDVAFVSMERIPSKERRPRSGFPRLAPDLVVEIASPGQSRPELSAKARRWLQAGVRLVWIVWPESQQVDVWEPESERMRTLRDAEELDGGDVLPGFTYALSELWR